MVEINEFNLEQYQYAKDWQTWGCCMVGWLFSCDYSTVELEQKFRELRHLSILINDIEQELVDKPNKKAWQRLDKLKRVWISKSRRLCGNKRSIQNDKR
jgi:hypothetical protein